MWPVATDESHFARAFRESREKTAPVTRDVTPELSLSEFIRQAWQILEPGNAFVPGWHIDAIADHLEAVTRGEIRNLLINMPPRHSKSLCVSVFWPTWEWTFAPERRWLFASYAQGLSTRDSVKCRRVIESQWYQQRWGTVYQLTGDQNVKTRYDNARTGYRIATSVGGSATGEGGDRIVVDDPHNVKEAWSDAKREAAVEWWDQVMSSRGNDPKTVTKVVVMQRVHETDLSGHLLAKGAYEHLCLPHKYDGKRRVTALGEYDERSEEGELLHPARFGAKEITALEAELGSYGTAAQLGQEPAPAGGGMIKREWFRFYYVDKPILGAFPRPPVFQEQMQSWDMAFKALADSDYVVGQVWAKTGADCWLLDQRRDLLDFPATVRAVVELSARYPDARRKLVEDKANGPAVISTLKRTLGGLIEVKPEGGKEARAAAVSPFIESGNVYLPHPSIAPWVDDFLLECERFPKGAHDDQVDAMSQALLRLSPRGQSANVWAQLTQSVPSETAAVAGGRY